MVKKQYKLFIIVFVLILVVGAAVSTKYACSEIEPSVGSYEFVLNETEDTGLKDVPLMFSFENGKSVLNCSSSIRESLNQVNFRYPYGDAAQTGIDEFSYKDSMNGTVLVQGQNADGSVQISAKSQPLITQGYADYAYDTHTFGDASIPLEICYGGSVSMSTDLQILVHGSDYTGEAVLKTKNGEDRTVTVEKGVLSGLRIQDLRTGVAVSVQDPESGALLIGSYVVEDYSLFSAIHLKALSNTLLLFALIAAGCLLLAGVRALIRSRKKKNLPTAL